ncbi:Protein NPG1 [Vitis vinifera]|uniref:Protein NPG1 n=1 Tax=Vitis vinifera TaxID=29760 RepID=A0A438C1W6_VITVI|nr:Protein NPG1 [Vitis vinifera]
MVQMLRSRSTTDSEGELSVGEVRANGLCMKTTEVEAKLDEGNIEEAESSLREGLSLNFEEARALLGRLEYQRGNVEGALRVFDGIDLQAAIQRLQPSFSERLHPRKGRSRIESLITVSQHAAGLVLEAIYLKAKSLQKLGRLTEAAHECKSVLDAVERIFHHGIPNVQVDSKLQETVSQAVELFPELWKQAGCYHEAMSAYRRALLSQWNLDNDCCARIQKGFAVFLLYSGVEAAPPSLAVQMDGSYVPRNNLEEAILLLMILMKKIYLGKTKWDPSVMEHLTFALSLCSQTSVLAKQLEEVMPGVFHRVDRWITLALCYSGAGQNSTSLNLLRKSLHKHERPDDLMALLLAAKICSEDSLLAAEGVGYAQRAISNTQGTDHHFKGVGLRMLGLCLAKQSKASLSDAERARLQSEALKKLNEAVPFERDNLDLIFELGVQYAEHRNLNVALRYAKRFIDATGGSISKGWRLLVMILSAQQRFSEAEAVTDAALNVTAKWEQGPLLRLKAKLKISESLPMDAIETFCSLLALAQAQRKSLGPRPSVHQGIAGHWGNFMLLTASMLVAYHEWWIPGLCCVDDDRVNEFEVWYGVATLYSSLSHWRDAEICLGKARELKEYSVELLHAEGKTSNFVYYMNNLLRLWGGVKFEGHGQIQEALAAYINALLLDPGYVPCKILIGALLLKMGSKAFPVVRSLLSDALRIEPTNRMAWYYLGMAHRDDGRIADATDCFQAASILEESNPIESFSSIL